MKSGQSLQLISPFSLPAEADGGSGQPWRDVLSEQRHSIPTEVCVTRQGGHHRPGCCTVGGRGDSCILLCLPRNQKWRRTTVYKLPWCAWVCCATARPSPRNGGATCDPRSTGTTRRGRRDKCCSAPREAGSGTSSLSSRSTPGLTPCSWAG